MLKGIGITLHTLEHLDTRIAIGYNALIRSVDCSVGATFGHSVDGLNVYVYIETQH